MAEKTVTRADLCEAVYQKVGVSRTESAELVELVLKEITDCIERLDTAIRGSQRACGLRPCVIPSCPPALSLGCLASRGGSSCKLLAGGRRRCLALCGFRPCVISREPVRVWPRGGEGASRLAGRRRLGPIDKLICSQQKLLHFVRSVP
jgi:hypothetical protein